MLMTLWLVCVWVKMNQMIAFMAYWWNWVKIKPKILLILTNFYLWFGLPSFCFYFWHFTVWLNSNCSIWFVVISSTMMIENKPIHIFSTQCYISLPKAGPYHFMWFIKVSPFAEKREKEKRQQTVVAISFGPSAAWPGLLEPASGLHCQR